MESIEKLRLYFEHKGLDDFRDELDDIADEIEREIAERYMKLPVDRKNEPWRIGDKFSFVDASGKQHICTVSGVSECEVFFYYDEHQDSTKHRHFKASSLVHVKPDPVKELLEKLVRDVRGSYYLTEEQNRWVDECAERIREAVEK